MKTNKNTPKQNTYRVEWFGMGGAPRADLIAAESPELAAQKVANSDCIPDAYIVGPMAPKATHKLDKITGQLIRIAL